jgi:hypothetical protein
MNKRSAMVIAAGLVLALLAGVAAVSLTLGGSGMTTASAVNPKPKPIVRTEKHTVIIHKQAKANPGSPTIVRVPSSAPTGVSAGSFSEDQYEAGESGDAFEGGGSGGGDD